MSDEDIDRIAEKMFFLLNFIVKKAISEPKELQAMYELTPASARKSAEEKDALNRAKQSAEPVVQNKHKRNQGNSSDKQTK